MRTRRRLCIALCLIAAVVDGRRTDARGAHPQALPTATIEKGPTTTTLASTPNPSGMAEIVELTATVDTAASANPTGHVQFFDGATLIGSAALSNRTATINTPALTVGAHSLTAVYGGDESFDGSASAALAHTVRQLIASAKTLLVVLPTPSQAGAPASLYAIVTALSRNFGDPPSGTVEFLDGTTSLGTAVLGPTPFAGYQYAVLTTSALSEGTHVLTARYAGDGTFAASRSGWALHTVYADAPPAATITTIRTSLPFGLNPGDPFSITIEVQSPGGVPSGSVYLMLNGTIVAALPLSPSGGLGRVTIPVTGGLPSGLYVLSALYVGSAQFAASSSQNWYHSVAWSFLPASAAFR